MKLRLGTRGSRLALAQAATVVGPLEETGLDVEVVAIKTSGDRSADWDRSEKGIFVAEIDQALERGEIDLAVHSLKDIPTDIPERLEVVCIPARGAPFDVVLPVGALKSLPAGARVGTSSIRRKAELARARPDLQAADLRGNVDSRLRKLESGEFDALLVAEAGLERLSVERKSYERLPAEVVVPPGGQGALAVVAARTTDGGSMAAARKALDRLDHVATRLEVTAERAFVSGMGAGCHSPVGALARAGEDGTLRLYAAIGGTEKRVMLTAKPDGEEGAVALGLDAARELGGKAEAGSGGGWQG